MPLDSKQWFRPFWHQGLVLWKTIFPCVVGGGFGMTQCIAFIVHVISVTVASVPLPSVRH